MVRGRWPVPVGYGVVKARQAARPDASRVWRMSGRSTSTRHVCLVIVVEPDTWKHHCSNIYPGAIPARPGRAEARRPFSLGAARSRVSGAQSGGYSHRSPDLSS